MRSLFPKFTATALISLMLLFLATGKVLASANDPVSTLGVANDSPYHYVLTGVDQHDASCEDACYPTLQPRAGDSLAQQWANIWTQTGSWINLSYDVCEAIDYDAHGNPQCDNYLGHVGLLLTKDKTEISSQDQGKATLETSDHTLFNVNFLPDNPPAVPDTPAPVEYSSAPFRGTNLAGAEFVSSSGDIGWIIDGAFPNASDLSYFGHYGMNTYRFPIRWSYIQPTLGGAFNQAYADKLYASTKAYLEAGYHVMIDLHNYMKFEPDPSQSPTGGKIVTAADLVDIWDKLSNLLFDLSQQYPSDAHSNHLMFDLMNEPMDDISPDVVVSYYNDVLAMLRDKGVTNLVLLEGTHWSGMHSWMELNADAFHPDNIHDDNYAINVHQYFDFDHSGTHVVCTGFPRENIEAFINWADTHQVKYMVTEFGGADSGNCQPIIQDFLERLHESAVPLESEQGGLLGWTVWAGGHYWGDYMLSIYQAGGAEDLPRAMLDWELLKAPE